MKLRVLSTEEEAYYGYLGAANALNLSDAFLIDIGGGSAEVTAIRGRGFVRSFSCPAGVLRFSERYVRSDPISTRDFKALEEAAAESFAGIEWLHDTSGTTLAGIGGTIRTLAEIDQKSRGYPLDHVHGYSFSRERLEEMIAMLRGMTLRQREDVPGLSRDRADLILAGAVILHAADAARPLCRADRQRPRPARGFILRAVSGGREPAAVLGYARLQRAEPGAGL